MIFPYGNKAPMVLPSERVARRRALALNPFADGDVVRPFEQSYEAPIQTCFDATGVGRENCSWDKDGRCVFCGRRRISSKWRS